MSVLGKIMREPLLHFLLLGGGLFLLYNMSNGGRVDKPNTIVVTPGKVKQLSANFSRTWERLPTEQELNGLLTSYLRDEVFYREAIALGLDKDDNLIRRRMRQKLEFILEDISVLVDPTDEALTRYMQQHEDQFRLQPQIAFRQVYLSPDKRQDIKAAATKILASLNTGEISEQQSAQLGDQIMLEHAFKLSSQSDIERRFGQVFARQLLTLPSGVWSGPVVSGYGGHLVLVSERVEGRMPTLAEVREEVQRDWLFEQRNALKESTYRKLLEEYEIVMQEPMNPAYVSGPAVAATRPETAPR
ncbi:MAG: peptidylprolyl isomerase [Gammaproteobacteria bacterium]